MTFTQQVTANVAETTETAERWIVKGRKDRAQKVVSSALADAEYQVGTVTIPGAAEALASGIAQLKVLLAKVSA